MYSMYGCYGALKDLTTLRGGLYTGCDVCTKVYCACVVSRLSYYLSYVRTYVYIPSNLAPAAPAEWRGLLFPQEGSTPLPTHLHHQTLPTRGQGTYICVCTHMHTDTCNHTHECMHTLASAHANNHILVLSSSCHFDGTLVSRTSPYRRAATIAQLQRIGSGQT